MIYDLGAGAFVGAWAAVLATGTAVGVWAIWAEIRRGQKRWDRQNPSVTRHEDEAIAITKPREGDHDQH